jgi:hypothetical protein
MPDERAAPKFIEDKYILGCGVRWSIVYPLGHDLATRRPLYHRKSIHGLKREAQAYLDWYAGLVAAGETPKETIAQWELKSLADLQAKAQEFKQKLLAKVESGTRVQPGPLTLTP